MKREIMYQIQYQIWHGGWVRNAYVAKVGGVWKLRDGRRAGDVFTEKEATSLVKHLAKKWHGLSGLCMVMA